MKILTLLLSALIAQAQYIPPSGGGGATCGTPDCAVSGNLSVGGNATIGPTVISGASQILTVGGQLRPQVPANGYFLWADDSDQNEFGLLRIRNTNQQALLAGYDPLYPKYTPDSQAFERWVMQWNISDPTNPVIEIGSEWGPTASVTSITRASSTATVTQTAHGYRTGDLITIEGSDQAEYNGDQTITVTGDDTYTYSVSGSPATPATGTITATGGASRTLRILGGMQRRGFTSDLYGTQILEEWDLYAGTQQSPTSFVPGDMPILLGNVAYQAQVAGSLSELADFQPFAVSYGGVNIGGELDWDVLGEDGNYKYYGLGTDLGLGLAANRPAIIFTDLTDSKVSGFAMSTDGNGMLTPGTFKAAGYQSSDGTAGATATVTVKGSDGNNCNLVYKNGLFVSTTCP